MEKVKIIMNGIFKTTCVIGLVIIFVSILFYHKHFDPAVKTFLLTSIVTVIGFGLGYNPSSGSSFKPEKQNEKEKKPNES